MMDKRDLQAKEERDVRREVTDLREHARTHRHKVAADKIVTILRDLLTSWRLPKDQKPS